MSNLRFASWLLAACLVPGLLQPLEAGNLPKGQAPRRILPERAPGGPSRDSKPPMRPTRLLVKLKGEAARALAAAPIRREGSPTVPSALEGFAARHRLAQVEPLIPAAWQNRLADAGRSQHPLRARRGRPVAPMADLSRIAVIRPEGNLEEALKRLRQDPAVEYAEVDGIATAQQSAGLPNDPFLTRSGSWGQDYKDLWGHYAIRAPEAWAKSTGRNVVVAVVDTGLDLAHPDLKANLWVNPGEIPGNGLDDDQNGFVDDIHGYDFVGDDAATPVEGPLTGDRDGHGTHVAGTIAATGNNGIGVVGVAFEARVMGVRVLDAEGRGSFSGVIRGLVYAGACGAEVANLSLTGYGRLLTLEDAIRNLHSAGVVVVAAAGNEGTDVVDAIPAAIPEVISVGAVNTPVIWDQGITWFSNRGIRLDILAPGSDILSLCAEGTNSAPLESHYARMEGTSMAAPHVAGVAALLLSRNPGLSVEAVRQLLRSTAKPDTSDPLVVAGGLGLVDADAALAETRVLEAHLSRPYPGEKITAPIEIQGTIQGQGVAGWELAWGAGRTPSAWHSLQSGTSAVVAGTLATLDPRALPEGVVTLRLSAKDDRGKIYRFDSVVEADFLVLQEPALPQLLAYALQFKPGHPIPIKGRVDFGSYVIEMAPGVLPESGWKTVGGGSGPRDGDLGTWTPDASLVAGHYTLRIRAEDGGVTRTDPTVVHLEPALISPQWPKFMIHPPNGGMIVRQDGSGNAELGAVTCETLGRPEMGSYFRFMPDGALLPAAELMQGSRTRPLVADLDAAVAGEEVVFNDKSKIIVMNGATKIRELDLGETYSSDQSVVLSRVKGAPALFAMSIQKGTHPEKRVLHVMRPDGTSVSGAFPMECGPDVSKGFYENVEFLVGDLDGDEKPEIIVSQMVSDSSWNLRAYSEEGQLLPWSTPEMQGPLTSLLLADLDRDGFMEILASHGAGMAVFRHDGSYYQGWPRTDIKGILVCGDLDRDGTEEIIAVDQSKMHVVKADGSPWSSDWPKTVNSNVLLFGTSDAGPALADVDGDGRQEILVSQEADSGGWILTKWPDFKNVWSDEGRLLALDTAGRTVKVWTMPGLGTLGGTNFYSKMTLGDFNRDGRLDVGASFVMSKTDSAVTWAEGGGLTVLTTSAPWAAGTHDWPCSTGDAWNRRTLLRDPKVALPGITGGMMVAGAWPVEIQAWNVPGRKEVWLEVDGQRVGSALLQAPFRLEWDTKASGLGNHAVQAFARTGSGGVVASPKVTVQVVDKIATAFGDLTLTQGRNPALVGEALTVEATLQPATATGEVSFTVGSASPVRVALVQGKASLALAKLAVGTHAVTAQYEGASFYSASASAPLSLKVWDYQLAASAAEVQVAPNQAGTVTVTLTPEGGFAGDVQLTCTGLPADVEARFTPLASGADGKQTSTLSLSLKPKPVPPSPGWLLGGGLLGLGFLAPRRRRRTVGAWVFGGLVLVGLVACGGGGGGSASKDKSYNAVVTGTWEGSTRSCTVKVVVKQ